MSAGVGQARPDELPVVVDLVTRARDGDRQAWDALVDRYAPLIWAICRRYRLDRADAEHVGQSVWLRLLEQLEKIRDPAALAGWLATTAQRECIRVLRTRWPHPAGYVPDASEVPDDQSATAGQELLAAERDAALREALARARILPAADCPAVRRPVSAVCGDQHTAGHRGREHRPLPWPVPGKAAPRSGHRGADQGCLRTARW